MTLKRAAALACLCAAALCMTAPRLSAQENADWPGNQGEWFGYESHDFHFKGRAAKVVLPKERAEGSPWIWRARFFGHEPQFDKAMLERGYVLVWLNSAPLMGSPDSVALWQDYYLWLRENFGLAKKACLEGMSRGGLYVMNWAFAYPDQVAAIYIDNPVLDFKSWPGGLGAGPGSKKDWEDVLKSYGLDEEGAKAYKLNPVDNREGCEALAKNNVGILLVCGDSDKTVPGAENFEPFKKLYESVGGPVELILKPGNDHHPHSLKDPAPIVNFMLKFNAPTDWPGKKGEWFGFESYEFKFRGRDAKVVLPHDQKQDCPWIWRARFFGHEPQFDVAMLNKGWGLAWIDSAPMLGSPKCVALWQEYYEWLRAKFGFGKKATLEGMSRGGLYALNWAFAHPDEVACLYLDNPLLDVRSAPGGFGKGVGSRDDAMWNDILREYGVDEETAKTDEFSPVGNRKGCEALAKNGVGILLICGDSDPILPAEENRIPFTKLYESVGGKVELILKPNSGHHPHSLKDPTPIVEFAEKYN